jgi:hypothetical protein
MKLSIILARRRYKPQPLFKDHFSTGAKPQWLTIEQIHQSSLPTTMSDSSNRDRRTNQMALRLQQWKLLINFREIRLRRELIRLPRIEMTRKKNREETFIPQLTIPSRIVRSVVTGVLAHWNYKQTPYAHTVAT